MNITNVDKRKGNSNIDNDCCANKSLTKPKLKRIKGSRGGSRAAATSKMEGLKALTIITKRSILDVAAVLDPPLGRVVIRKKEMRRHKRQKNIKMIKIRCM